MSAVYLEEINVNKYESGKYIVFVIWLNKGEYGGNEYIAFHWSVSMVNELDSLYVASFLILFYTVRLIANKSPYMRHAV